MDWHSLAEVDNWWRSRSLACVNEDSLATLSQCGSALRDMVRRSRLVKGKAIRILIAPCCEMVYGHPNWQDGPSSTMQKMFRANNLASRGVVDRRMFKAASIRLVICSCGATHSINDNLFRLKADIHYPNSLNSVMATICAATPAQGPDRCCLALTCPRCSRFQLLIDRVHVTKRAVTILMKLITACPACSSCRCSCRASSGNAVVAICDVPGCTRMLCAKCIGHTDTSSFTRWSQYPTDGNSVCKPPALCPDHMNMDPPLGVYSVGKHIRSNVGRHAAQGNWSVSFKSQVPILHSEDAVCTAAIEGIRRIIEDEQHAA